MASYNKNTLWMAGILLTLSACSSSDAPPPDDPAPTDNRAIGPHIGSAVDIRHARYRGAVLLTANAGEHRATAGSLQLTLGRLDAAHLPSQIKRNQASEQ